MLKIRSEQIKVLENVASRNFEKELIQHIKEFAPKHSEVIEDEGVQEVVRLGIERADGFGFTKRGPIRFYVELMFMFGSDFDTDFQLPWAKGTLNNEIIKDEMERADILHEKMVEYLEIIAGPESEFALKALRKLTKAQIEDYKVAGGTFDKHMMMALSDVYPQKYEYIGEELIQTLLDRSKELAKKHSITSEKGNSLFVALMFAVGHGFTNDALFPWISKTLQDDSIPDPNIRAERLEKKMKIYLERAVSHLEDNKK